MRRQFAVGLLFGVIVALPLVARGGGDLCVGSGGVNHYDNLRLQLSSVTVDGEARPLPEKLFESSLFSVASAPGSDFDRAAALVPDFSDPQKERATVSVRRHH